MTDRIEATKGVATVEQMALVDFEPFTKEELDAIAPPTFEDVKPHLTTLRIAWKFLAMTKLEMIEALEKLPDDVRNDLFDGFASAADFFKGWAGMMACAETRLLATGSTLGLEEEAAEEKRSPRAK